MPLRLEIGPKDHGERISACMVRRDNREKVVVPLDAAGAVRRFELLDAVHEGLYQKCQEEPGRAHLRGPHAWKRPSALQQEHGGFIKTMWCERPGL